MILTDSADVEELVKVNRSELVVNDKPENCECEQVKFHLKEVSVDGRMNE